MGVEEKKGTYQTGNKDHWRGMYGVGDGSGRG